MSTQVVVQPMQWASTKDIEEVEPVSDKDAEIFRELREVLVKHNAVDRFGVTLIHKHFDLAENEQLVEFTDLEKRWLMIKPVSDSEALNTIETSWRFSTEPEGPRYVMANCVGRCFSNPNSTPQHKFVHNVE